MLERLNGERLSSFVILLVAVALVAGLLLESTRTVAGATRIAAIVGGLLIVLYGAGVTLYLVLRGDRDRAGPAGDSPSR